ncbi:nitrate- and nitrite sensing domain-containing protein [Nonomuraea sp. MCN248]|uniref:histidine kinase n=1 Tax=Nonomuraea corallina TaxID=2989783 RepID=A0ABT4SDW5_9ACTN|nr:nitrate- and nitrite sensing domain-containing protein [Nonomuraea corallina]MDA0635394.1 nitrate- and nitrite sensing domain-containing protein [Nonomuraea corallina]
MRTRLIALIAIPTVVGVLLGGLRVGTSVASAQEYARVGEVNTLISDVGELTHNLAAERDRAARFVASNRRPSESAQLETQHGIVDASIERTLATADTVQGSLSDLGRRRLDIVRIRLSQLPAMRETVKDTQLPPLPTVQKYGETITELLQLFDEVSSGAADEQIIATGTAMRAVARAEEETSKQRALLASALLTGEFTEPEFDAFVDARARRESERETFQSAATSSQRELFDNTVASAEVGRAEFYVKRAIFLHNSPAPLQRLDITTTKDVDRWFDSITQTVDKTHAVQKALSQEIATRAADLQSADRQAAAFSIGLVVLLLVLVLVVTAIMARSLVRPLRRLRGDALKVAGKTLPGLVRQLREGEADPESLHVPPIQISSKDEIGEVARAFDEVHREAVRLAGEEARLRANVNAMFVNLSRRSQTLVERQITLIDGLEQGEQDEQRLANLFKLDHLATRMRRNSENLLVLAGQEPPRRWSQPVKLVDVARASLSEVENYERVVLQVPDGVSVAGQAVNDVIHLIAELVENALSFSPRETRVTVSGSRIDGGGVMLSITDSGIGMTGEELAQANERLGESAVVDVSVSRRMGLFVVSRLAQRHGIRVQLRPQGGGGLTAMVLLPETLLGMQAMPFDGSPGAAGALAGMQRARADVHASQPPAPQWGDNGFQMSPAHPSYPPNADPSGSWPSSAMQWPSSGPDSWASGPRSGGFDTDDVWIPSRVPGSWANGPSPLPERTADPLPTRNPGGRGRQTYDFPETAESGATGPIPAVNPSSGGDDYLPIFASVESAWFERGGSSGAWGSATADAGWTAAQAAAEPVRDGATASGLPKRVPKANLVPGSADTASAPKGVAPMPAISPERVRNRLASFQKGFRAARDDLSEGRASLASDPRNAESREEGA